jgi:hypothetical protein
MFCNHYFLCFLFLIASNFLASKAQAQEELAIIPVRKASARTIRHFEIGDSVFITYRESSIDAATTRYNMVLPDRSVVPLNLPQLNKRDILTVLSHGDSLRFYFVAEVEQEQVLKALVLNRYTGISRLSARSIPIPEALVGILGDTVLTINKRDSTLRIKLLTEMKLVNLRQIKIPADFMNMQISRAVIDHGLEAYPAKAAASLKFYTHPDKLYITLDNVSATRDRGKSYVLHVDLTEPSATPVRYAIPYSPKGHFSSFLHNDLLYRVSKDRDGLYLQIFDSLANRVGYFTFNRPWKSSSNTAYIRGSDSKRVLDERTVWDAISNTMDVFVSVHPYDSSRVILKVGGHRAVNGGGCSDYGVFAHYPGSLAYRERHRELGDLYRREY